MRKRVFFPAWQRDWSIENNDLDMTNIRRLNSGIKKTHRSHNKQGSQSNEEENKRTRRSGTKIRANYNIRINIALSILPRRNRRTKSLEDKESIDQRDQQKKELGLPRPNCLVQCTADKLRHPGWTEPTKEQNPNRRHDSRTGTKTNSFVRFLFFGMRLTW